MTASGASHTKTALLTNAPQIEHGVSVITDAIRPFRFRADLDAPRDLKQRLERTAWPEEFAVQASGLRSTPGWQSA